ncbi:MAG: hypothetical protein CM1200mP10_04840 [Candidatus Neomarinimicrobiota bacterium]|nr:MAG: hypothetical protein CM1200mP10_04840 [Candidatus Neomarinimicrobiota bacterium]
MRLTKRYGGAKYPQVYIVDMDQEQEDFGKTGPDIIWFSIWVKLRNVSKKRTSNSYAKPPGIFAYNTMW